MNKVPRPPAGLAALLAGLLQLGCLLAAQAQTPSVAPAAPAAPGSDSRAARAASSAVTDAEPAVSLPGVTPTSKAGPGVPVSGGAPSRARKQGTVPPGAAGATVRGAAGKRTAAMDNLELERTQITGNRELPKVMVVVPWKRADIGDLIGRPVNSLVDEALQPVDREVFRREIAYYGALAPDRPAAAGNETPVAPAAGAGPAAGPEK